jgi:hypothetical protein
LSNCVCWERALALQFDLFWYVGESRLAGIARCARQPRFCTDEKRIRTKNAVMNKVKTN